MVGEGALGVQGAAGVLLVQAVGVVGAAGALLVQAGGVAVVEATGSADCDAGCDQCPQLPPQFPQFPQPPVAFAGEPVSVTVTVTVSISVT